MGGGSTLSTVGGITLTKEPVTYLEQSGEQVEQDEGHGEDDLCLGHQDCQVEHQMSYKKIRITSCDRGF